MLAFVEVKTRSRGNWDEEATIYYTTKASKTLAICWCFWRFTQTLGTILAGLM